MRRRTYCRARSTSAGCPPGCCLPCCAPRRRRSPRVNRCAFVPPPAKTTTRYCGDPCSPPPPRCTPKRVFGSRCRRPSRPRASMCCTPCPPRNRPTLCSPCTYSRPFHALTSNLFSSTNPCRPKKCGPLDPCVPSVTRRFDQRPTRKKCDPCVFPSPNSLPSPGCCEVGKTIRPTCKIRKSRRSASPKRRSGRSSCGSSYCESPCSKSPAAGRCRDCGYSPCSCDKSSEKGHQEQVNCPSYEDASKGPTSWFLKKSEKCGKTKSPNEPHFCPWEAEVTVTGTVRGHCTSTAEEVAKRLTGKFSSRGHRYTTCKKSPTKCGQSNDKCKPQKMALGYLDDGTKLDFSRNRCEDYGEDTAESRECCVKGRTNNAKTDATVSANRWRLSRDHSHGSQRRHSSRGHLDFATAYIGRSRDESKDKHAQFEEIRQDEVYPISHRKYCRASETADHRSRHSHHGRHRYSRARIHSVVSDSDQSSYITAPESIEMSRRHPNSWRDADDYLHSRRKGRRKDVELPTDKSRLPGGSSCRREAWWGRHNYHRTRLDDNNYYNDDEEEDDAEGDVINFKLVCDDNGNDSDNVSDNDDIDKVNPQPSPPQRRFVMERGARTSDRRSLSPATHSRRSSWSRAPRTHRHWAQTSGAARHVPDLAQLHVDASSGQSSDGEWERGRSSSRFYSKARDRLRGESVHQSKYMNHRKRVSYEKGL
ncbi:hypothetical protein EGW08_010395 [Elysia chlorotica]|uniref:Uncharacterized protein n=1 Tax=Elysia chlorotica TaxID=188477 RepID=A0A3S1BIX8_ELYCH|nr:hypothetical protein EGW08_010395 [Elysia chlorotica]